MHYLTSNFNLLYSNSLWGSLKKEGVIIDNDFDSYYLNLINNQNLKKYNSFHTVIFLDKNNFSKNKKKIKSLIKIFNKFSSKTFFIYLTFSKDLNKKKVGEICGDLKKLKKVSNNLFFELLFQDQKEMHSNRNLSVLKFPFDITFISNLTKIIKKKLV